MAVFGRFTRNARFSFQIAEKKLEGCSKAKWTLLTF